MNTITDPDLVAVDRFVSSIYWSDDDIAFADALSEAVDEWTAAVAAQHNESQPFSTVTHDDELGASMHEFLAAVTQLNVAALPGLTVMCALSKAVADWSHQALTSYGAFT